LQIRQNRRLAGKFVSTWDLAAWVAPVLVQRRGMYALVVQEMDTITDRFAPKLATFKEQLQSGRLCRRMEPTRIHQL